MNIDMTTISAEALRRLQVEAAYARGVKIEIDVGRKGAWESWRMSYAPSWNWAEHNYRVKPTAKPHRTKAQILDQIHELLVELRHADGDA